MKLVDPEPTLVFWPNTGVHTIFPDIRDFLWDPNYGGNPTVPITRVYNSCPPKNCEFKKSLNGFAGPCNTAASPSTDATKNGYPDARKWGVGTINTATGSGVPFFSKGEYICM